MLCDYDSKHASLETSIGSTLNIGKLKSRDMSVNWPARHILEIPLRLCRTSTAERAIFQVSCEELNLLDKFQSRTVLTLGNGGNVGIYKREMVKLAFAVREMLRLLKSLC